jgi:flagellar FliL protein
LGEEKVAKKKDAEEVEEGSEVQKKSKKGLFIIIIIVVLLLGGGGFGAYWFLLRAPAPTAEELAEIEAAKKPEPVILPVFALKPFVVNLADKKSRRYLKVTMKLELSNEELLACDIEIEGDCSEEDLIVLIEKLIGRVATQISLQKGSV